MNTVEALKILDRIVEADQTGRIETISHKAAEGLRFRFYRARNHVRKQLAEIDDVSPDQVVTDYDHLTMLIEAKDDGTAVLVISPATKIELELGG